MAPHAPNTTSHLPRCFQFSIGGYASEFHQLKLKSGRLIYQTGTTYVSQTKEVLAPTREQWETFWAALATAGVWSWLPRYDSDILDGTQWSLTIRYNGQQISSSGSNAYPGGHDGCFPRESAFFAFLLALRLLTGKHIR